MDCHILARQALATRISTRSFLDTYTRVVVLEPERFLLIPRQSKHTLRSSLQKVTDYASFRKDMSRSPSPMCTLESSKSRIKSSGCLWWRKYPVCASLQTTGADEAHSRVSITDYRGNIILDTFVHPTFVAEICSTMRCFLT